MVGEWEFRTMQGLAIGCFRQSRQNPHATPPASRLFEENALATNGEGVMFGEKAQRRARPFSGQGCRFGRSAKTFDWAGRTFWPRGADERAEFHEGRVMLAGVVPGKEFRGQRPQLFAPGACINRRLHVEEPGQDASDVCFDDWHGLIERERGDSVRRVTAYAGKATYRIWQTWECAVFLRHGNRSRAKVPRPSVITEALPGVKNLMFGRRRQRGQGGEPAEPLIIIRDNGSDLGLLEHEFRDEDRIGVRGSAPREIAAIFAVPRKKGSA